ncbi:hypothetical protein N9K72_04185 [Pontimonas sp.]|nr:hypothetical protein [Pontimonas sp.]
MTKLLWMTIDRHPDSLKALIRDQLSDAGWDLYEVSYDSIDSLKSVPLESIDAVLLAPARHFPVQYMDRLTSCKLMQIWSSGYDKFNINDAHQRGIPVANNHGSNAVSVAEHAILMMLGVSRRVPEMHRRVIDGNWAGNDHGMSSFSLFGKTLGIIGLGNIGSLVAKRAETLGMKVLFTDPGIENSPSSQWRKVAFNELLRQSDYITFHVHLAPETRGMINDSNLDLLVRRPFIINVSRAELVSYPAAMRALEKGLIKGLAMDAHYMEPTASEDPLYRFTNVFFSPHVAGSTVDSYDATIKRCRDNILAALTALQPKGLILEPGAT